LPCSKKTKTSYSTDKEVLEAIEDKHEIVPLVLEYRSLSKLASTYGEGLLNSVGTDGRIHTTFMQAVTATGRLSSVEPNLQNIPVRTEIGSRIRECFTVPNQNTKLVDADYSQIELRVLAHISDDKNMQAAFLSGEDIHASTAAKIHDLPIDSVTPEMRRDAKAVNFGIVYGIGAFSLAKDIGVTRAEADKYIKGYLHKFSGVDSYMQKVIADAKLNGYVSTIFGRRRYLPDVNAKTRTVRALAERNAINAPIQGSSADMIKIAMINIHQEMKAKELKSKMILQVHDELVFDVCKEELNVLSELIKDKMINALQLDVPIIVNINTGNNWLEAH
jgi:DNA polymerase-1